MESSRGVNLVTRLTVVVHVPHLFSKTSESAQMETAKLSGCEKEDQSTKNSIFKLKAWSSLQYHQ